jgi:hypothetical protein
MTLSQLKSELQECKYCKKSFRPTRKDNIYCSASCQKSWAYANKPSTREKIKQTNRKYYKSNKNILLKAYKKMYNDNKEKLQPIYNARAKEYYKKSKEKILERKRRHNKEKKDINVVRRLTYKNERENICSLCHKKGKTDFHHLSYFPNIFVELCKSCHMSMHAGNISSKEISTGVRYG